MSIPNPFPMAGDLLAHDLAEEGSLLGHLNWKPLPHQVPPEPPWDVWFLKAGRGSGKTDAGANWLDAHVNGPPCNPQIPGGHRPAIIAPTLGDAVEACVNGPSGLKAHNPGIILVQRKGGTFVEWPNGATAKLFGAYTPEDVERLRAGGNRCCVWAEELAAWRYLRKCWDHMQFGLRIGAKPKVVVTSTPKNRPLIKELQKDPTTTVTKAKMDDNPYLPENRREKLTATYGGTRLGRQELDAEDLEDVEGALWTSELIERERIDRLKDPDGAAAAISQLRRIVVAVDPSWGTKGAEVGIVVAGLGWDGRGYVLEDRSARAAPAVWGERVKDAYNTWQADRIVAEINFAAEQVRLVMQTVDPRLTFKELRASRGKQQRAEPVVALYEQRRVSHVGTFPGLEDQMTTWVPGETDKDEDDEVSLARGDDGEDRAATTPDRIDALVWALTELMLDPVGPTKVIAGSARPMPKMTGSKPGRVTGT